MKTTLSLPRACSHCEAPAVAHVCVPPEALSRFLCADHALSTDRFVERYGSTSKGAVRFADAVAEYPTAEETAEAEPCGGVSYPGGFWAAAVPCDGWAEPGETVCRECRNEELEWRALYEATKGGDR